jgi:DNA polymerase-3 subunit gamma/tau
VVPAVAEVGPGAGGTEAVRRMWPDVMARLGGLKRVTWSLVSHYAQVLDYDGTRLLLQFDSPGRAASFSKGAHQEFLRQALIDVAGIDCRFETTAQGSGNGASGARPAPPAPAPAAPAPAPGPGAAPSAPSPSQAPPSPAGRAEAPASSRPSPRQQAPARRAAEPPSDDIPLPPEPPPDDVPPEDTDAPRGRSPRSAAPPAARPAAPAQAAPEVTTVVLPPAPAARTAGPTTRPAGPSVRPADDVPSADDPDLEGSNLVGASVVEQLLGGRVIEDRKD